MVSDSLKCVFERLDRLLPETEPEDELRKGGPRDFTGVFKMHEQKVYKRLHKWVVNDKGVPTLKKRGFAIPGQRKILEAEERAQLNLDTEEQAQMTKESDLEFSEVGKAGGADQGKDAQTPYGGSGAGPSFSAAARPQQAPEAHFDSLAAKRS